MQSKSLKYFVLNFAALILICAVSALNDFNLRHDPLIYLFLLFFLCTIPFWMASKMSGPYCILVIFSPIYFIYYGFTDFISYIYPIPAQDYVSGYSLSSGEIGILIAWISLLVGYISAVKIHSKSKKRLIAKDWSTKHLIVIGLTCVFIGIMATWFYQLGANDRYNVSREQLSGLKGMFMIGGRMLEPVGVVLIVYAYLKTNSKLLFQLVVGICAIKIPLAFVLDSKEIALQNMIIFFACKWLYDGKIPIKWMVTFSVIVSLLFPIFYAYRSTVFSSHTTRAKAMSSFTDNLDKAMSKSDKSEKVGKLQSGIISFTGRIHLKPIFNLVIHKTGNGVPYQDGYTISLLFYALIPRIILPNKPDSSTGQLFNQAYHISADPSAYMSSTFLGELYWNFGWTGVILGMLIIGGFFGMIGAKANIAETKSVTRLLVLITTIYLLCFRFESGIAIQYTQWVRAILIIFILNKMFSRPINQSNIAKQPLI